MKIRRQSHFDAAHTLINCGPPKCRRLHGHTYVLEVEVEGPVENGMVIDFGDLDDIVEASVLKRWDHRFLNDQVPEGMETTAENLALLAAQMIADKLPAGVTLSRLTLREGLNNSAVWTPEA